MWQAHLHRPFDGLCTQHVSYHTSSCCACANHTVPRVIHLPNFHPAIPPLSTFPSSPIKQLSASTPLSPPSSPFSLSIRSFSLSTFIETLSLSLSLTFLQVVFEMTTVVPRLVVWFDGCATGYDLEEKHRKKYPLRTKEDWVNFRMLSLSRQLDSLSLSKTSLSLTPCIRKTRSNKQTSRRKLAYKKSRSHT